MVHEAIINYHPEEKVGQTKLQPMPLFVSASANILTMWRHLCEILSELTVNSSQTYFLETRISILGNLPANTCLCACHLSPDSITNLNLKETGSEGRDGLKWLYIWFSGGLCSMLY